MVEDNGDPLNPASAAFRPDITLAGNPPMCEVCDSVFVTEDLEDGCTLSADCCGRTGLCRHCRLRGNHDCDEGIPY